MAWQRHVEMCLGEDGKLMWCLGIHLLLWVWNVYLK